MSFRTPFTGRPSSWWVGRYISAAGSTPLEHRDENRDSCVERPATMKHFALEEWVDFVRGLVTGSARAEMAAHLATGCARCTRATEMLGRTARVMAADAQVDVPEAAVRRARAIFTPKRVDPFRLPRIAARLMFDSALAPAAAGLRSGEQPTRRALFHAGSFFIDLRFEREPGSPALSLVGQLASRQGDVVEPGGRAVLLTAGKAVVARATTNRFGEFQLEYEPAPHLRLHLPVAPAGRIELPLSKLTAGMAQVARPARQKKEADPPR
jgi:hypothetical protein